MHRFYSFKRTKNIGAGCIATDHYDSSESLVRDPELSVSMLGTRCLVFSQRKHRYAHFSEAAYVHVLVI